MESSTIANTVIKCITKDFKGVLLSQLKYSGLLKRTNYSRRERIQTQITEHHDVQKRKKINSQTGQSKAKTFFILKNQTEIYLLSSSPEFDGRKQLSQPEHIYLSSTFCVIQYTTTLGAGLKGLSHKHVKSCLDQRWMTISTVVEKWLIISIRSTSATCEME